MQINGFSKLSKKDKINWLLKNFFSNDIAAKQILEKYWFNDQDLQKLHDNFTENPISNYVLPYSVVPNFLIDNTLYAIPMVTEESSVVAAAAKAAKFWLTKGGFKTEVLGTTKTGHIHFIYTGSTTELFSFFKKIKTNILQEIEPLQKSMQQRDGGVKSIHLIDKTAELPNYYQVEFEFETVNAMGANFINTILEQSAVVLQKKSREILTDNLQIIMSILSNYNPKNIVRASVSCLLDELKTNELTGKEYAEKFVLALQIAEKDISRATTHNKGIMNGVDAVVIATGNDFRAVEAGAHSYAAQNGKYSSLSHARIKGNIFEFWLDLPLSIGTIGGLTSLHPLAKFSLNLLKNPSAKQLMRIIASVGLAQNFSAINSLITNGIQKGHMKMHLNNMLSLLNATEAQRKQAVEYFNNKKISFNELKKFLNKY